MNQRQAEFRDAGLSILELMFTILWLETAEDICAPRGELADPPIVRFLYSQVPNRPDSQSVKSCCGVKIHCKADSSRTPGSVLRPAEARRCREIVNAKQKRSSPPNHEVPFRRGSTVFTSNMGSILPLISVVQRSSSRLADLHNDNQYVSARRNGVSAKEQKYGTHSRCGNINDFVQHGKHRQGRDYSVGLQRQPRQSTHTGV
jgi:hypothetical protein